MRFVCIGLAALGALLLAGCGERDGEKLANGSRRPRDCAKDPIHAIANSDLGQADEQVRLGDYRRANILLRDGLEALGDDYADPHAHDDTGLHLALARDSDWRGDLQAAARGRRAILEERLTVYAHFRNLTGCPTPEVSAKSELPLPEVETAKP